MAKPHTITPAKLKEAYEDFNFAYNNLNTSEFDVYIKARSDMFLDAFDHNDSPSHYAKSIVSSTKKNLLETAWNQWVAVNEAEGEQVYGLTVGDTMGELSPIQLIQGFHAYLGGWIEAMAAGYEDVAE